jgi:hypothetical protein
MAFLSKRNVPLQEKTERDFGAYTLLAIRVLLELRCLFRLPKILFQGKYGYVIAAAQTESLRARILKLLSSPGTDPPPPPRVRFRQPNVAWRAGTTPYAHSVPSPHRLF